MQTKAILWRLDYEEWTILQQNEDPDNLTNQQLSNTLMSKMSVFHQKPNTDLQGISVVAEEDIWTRTEQSLQSHFYLSHLKKREILTEPLLNYKQRKLKYAICNW